MSLINEALKKAQRVRHEDPTDSSAGAGTGRGGIAKRGKANSTNTMVLIGSGALVLVVLSVVLTVYLVNRPSKSVARIDSAAVSPVEKATSAGPSAETPAPIVITPTLSVPKTTAPVEPSVAPPPVVPPTLPVAPTDSTKQSPAPDNSTAIAPTVARVAPAPVKTAPIASVPAGPDERVTTFVEAIRVTGIRSSGAESRVLMNERVYRVNDVVERNLGVRLVKVDANSLTFSDPNGITYVKNF
jgi:hypothetical protein